jgi:hypothetical protein
MGADANCLSVTFGQLQREDIESAVSLNIPNFSIA